MPDPNLVHDSPALLTIPGRRLLEGRVQVLERRLEELRLALAERDRDSELVAEHFRIARELDDLRDLLSEAQVAEEAPADPHVVELGDHVVIRLESGVEHCFIVTHAVEAAVDDERISSESPLGRALLRQRVGSSIEVEAPAGAYSCTIVSATRGE